MHRKLQEAIGIPADDVNLKLLKPPKQKEVGSFNYVVTPNAVCQADLTFWPNDHGYQYLLSIVDVVDRSIDAEPLRTKTSIAIKDGFDKIFARNYVKPTFRILQTDPGSEFKNATIKEYFNDKNIVMRYGRTGRHNQQAIIEYYNGVIGKTLNTKMSLSELATTRTNKIWRRNIPQIIQTLNEHFKKEPLAFKEFLKPPKIQSKNSLDLNEGDLVHVKLEEPRNIVSGAKFHGQFRHGELRWTKERHIVEQVLIYNNSYPRYKIEGFPGITFSRYDLQK